MRAQEKRWMRQSSNGYGTALRAALRERCLLPSCWKAESPLPQASGGEFDKDECLPL